MLFKLLILAVSLSGALSHSTGADDIACNDLTPRHGFPVIPPQSTPMPVTIQIMPHVINAGDVITVRLSGAIFRGFMIQARILGSGAVTGSFEFTSGMQHMNCPQLPLNSVATHRNADPKTSYDLRWRAPTDFAGAFIQVNFFYSIVQTYETFWNNGVSSQTVFISRP